MNWTQDKIDDDQIYSDFDDAFDEDEFLDCAMGRDGQCGKAGSEECDFECPIMLSILREQSRKRKART